MSTAPRLCGWCGQQLVPRHHENAFRFGRRKYCSVICFHHARQDALCLDPPPVKVAGCWTILGELGISDDGRELSLLVADPQGREVLLRWPVPSHSSD